MEAVPQVLLAAPADVSRRLRRALEPHLQILPTETWESAIRHLEQSEPQGIVVCYAFDEARPFRLIRYARTDWQGRRLPIVLVRAIHWYLGEAQEAQIRDAYRTLGVEEFFNLSEEVEVHGEEKALQRFRESVMNALARHR